MFENRRIAADNDPLELRQSARRRMWAAKVDISECVIPFRKERRSFIGQVVAIPEIILLYELSCVAQLCISVGMLRQKHIIMPWRCFASIKHQVNPFFRNPFSEQFPGAANIDVCRFFLGGYHAEPVGMKSRSEPGRICDYFVGVIVKRRRQNIESSFGAFLYLRVSQIDPDSTA